MAGLTRASTEAGYWTSGGRELAGRVRPNVGGDLHRLELIVPHQHVQVATALATGRQRPVVDALEKVQLVDLGEPIDALLDLWVGDGVTES